MTAAFIVNLDTESSTDLLGIADEIRAILSSEYSVLSVHPWQRPSLPFVPPEQQQNQK